MTAFRITHRSPRVYSFDGPVREAVTYHDETVEGQAAALRAFTAYLEAWEAVDPTNRHVNRDGHVRAVCVERPAGCECRVCTEWQPQQPEREWWYWGASYGHRATPARVKRIDAVVPRSTEARWRVVRRPVNQDGTPALTVSEHHTRVEAARGLSAAVRTWRDYGAKTAAKLADDAYVLKLHRANRFRLTIEPIAQEA